MRGTERESESTRGSCTDCGAGAGHTVKKRDSHRGETSQFAEVAFHWAAEGVVGYNSVGR